MILKFNSFDVTKVRGKNSYFWEAKIQEQFWHKISKLMSVNAEIIKFFFFLMFLYHSNIFRLENSIILDFQDFSGFLKFKFVILAWTFKVTFS